MKDEVSFSSKYPLMASINYSGTLDQGHYWAVVIDLNSRDRLSCNDKVVLTIAQYSLNNTFLTFSLGVTTSYITPVQVGGLSLLIQPSGIYTPERH